MVPADRPAPLPGPGQILVAVAAAGVNRPDALQRQGLYPPPKGASPLPGLEIAGTVSGHGEGVTSPPLGTRVMALLPGGGYAETVAVDARHILPLPDDLSFVEAAAMPETLFTVFANLIEAGQLVEGARVLVHGLTSGIGTMAIRLATAYGAFIWGTAGTADRCRAAEALGAVRCYDYRQEDWAAALSTEPPMDIVLDMIGGDYVAKNLGLLAIGGRHVSIAFLGGAKATIPIPLVMTRRLHLTGSTLRSRSDEEKARLTAAIAQHVLPMIAEGTVRPVIDSVFPLAEAADAHRRLDDHHIGKIVLSVDGAAAP